MARLRFSGKCVHNSPEMQALPSSKERWRLASARLLRPIDPATRFARRLAESRGDFHHESLAETAKCFAVRLDVPGLLGDIIIVFVDDDPASLEVAKAYSPAFDIGNFQRDPIDLRRLSGDRKKCQMGKTVFRTADRDHDPGRPEAS